MTLAEAAQLDGLLGSLVGDPRLVHVERLPAREARPGQLTHPLPEQVWSRLGVDQLWSHQATAIDLVRSGTSVAVATGTASGKSLCFQAPLGEAAAHPVRPSSALLLLPTKALAQDQLRALVTMDLPGVVATTYDGDSSTEHRTWARGNANAVLTNPDMLHAGILPHHDRWATFLHRLRLVVVDELHLLRGIFGSNVAHLLRRLRRLCHRYGSDPTFVFTSATLGQPGALASALCGKPVVEVTEDGSPRGERLFVLWNPAARPPDGAPGTSGDHGTRGVPGIDEADRDPSPADRRAPSTNRETARLVAALVAEGHRTIAFCRSRKGTEVVAADARRQLPGGLAASVRPYRGGYLAAERRAIEQELFDGDLRAVVATNALELGIDIGGLDACVLSGFPGTIASMWQQAGRAGRAQQRSITILVAGDDQLDQWLMAHPDQVFTRPPEPAVVNPSNPHLLHPHLACAAYEQPLRPDDDRWWPDLDEGVRQMVLDDHLRLRPPRTDRRGRLEAPMAVWAGRGWPSRRIGLRSGAAAEVAITRPDGTPVGTVSPGRAPHLVHPGAIYLHQGETYRVSSLDLDELVAVVEPTPGGQHTQPRTRTELALLGEDERRAAPRHTVGLGPVRVRSQVTGYKRFDSYTGELLSVEALSLPPSELETRAFWLAIEPELLDEVGLGPDAAAGALHAVEHAAIGILPLFTICDRWDVGGVSTLLQPETGTPTIVVYDGYPGGAGVAELGLRSAAELLEATADVIASCPCERGCPSCVQSPKCGNGNEPLDKPGALALLRHLTG